MKGSDNDIDKSVKGKRTPTQRDNEIWIVMYQTDFEDLPPYVWHLDRVFQQKSLALAYALGFSQSKDRKVKVMCQYGLGQPIDTYRISDGELISYR